MLFRLAGNSDQYYISYVAGFGPFGSNQNVGLGLDLSRIGLLKQASLNLCRVSRDRVSAPGVDSVSLSCSFMCRNSLEALVWEKEAEVDRCRDRWPMSMLVSRSRMFNIIEENKPRDVLAALNANKGKGGVAVLAEARVRYYLWRSGKYLN